MGRGGGGLGAGDTKQESKSGAIEAAGTGGADVRSPLATSWLLIKEGCLWKFFICLIFFFTKVTSKDHTQILKNFNLQNLDQASILKSQSIISISTKLILQNLDQT